MEPILELVLDFARAIRVPVRSQDAEVRAPRAEARAEDARPLHGRVGAGRVLVAERVLAHLRALPGGVSEFMTHPG